MVPGGVDGPEVQRVGRDCADQAERGDNVARAQCPRAFDLAGFRMGVRLQLSGFRFRVSGLVFRGFGFRFREFRFSGVGSFDRRGGFSQLGEDDGLPDERVASGEARALEQGVQLIRGLGFRTEWQMAG